MAGVFAGREADGERMTWMLRGCQEIHTEEAACLAVRETA